MQNPFKGRRITPGAKEAPRDYPASVPPLTAMPSVRVPAFSPRHTYGGDGTIHRTGTIDIQQDEAGNVVAVWFRCLNLPFTVSQFGEPTSVNPRETVAIEEITYAELEPE